MNFKAILTDGKGNAIKERESNLLGDLQLWAAVLSDSTENIAYIWDTTSKELIEIVAGTEDFIEYFKPEDRLDLVEESENLRPFANS